MGKPKALSELDAFEDVFRALAHETRRQVLTVLNARGGSMTAGEIAERFSCSWPTTSRHLRMLQDAGLVLVEQQGREWRYEINNKKLNHVVGGWLSWFTKKEKET